MSSNHTVTLNELFNSEIDDFDENQSFYSTEMDCRHESKIYTTLQNAKPGSSPITSTSYGLQKSPFLTSPDDVNLLSWKEKHPEHWSSQEVLDWLYYVADNTPDVQCKSLHGENFRNIDGPTLCNMTPDAFQRREPEYGMKLYTLFRSLLENASFTAPRGDYGTFNFMDIDISTNPALQSTCDYVPSAMQIDDDEMNTLSFMGGLLPKSASVTINNLLYDFDLDKNSLDFILSDTPPCPTRSDDGYISGSEGDSVGDRSYIDVFDNTEDVTTSPHQVYSKSRQAYSQSVPYNNGPYMEVCEPTQHTKFGSQHTKLQTMQPAKIVKRPGRPKKNRDMESVSSGAPPQSQKPKTKGSKGNHLWEFIRDTLKNPIYNPQLLKWENKSEGVFKFVQSEAVASMWGQKKNNPAMTYEKLSRAMRFCRSAGYFTTVPKTGSYPKKLCFKFGPKATGWQ